MAFLTEDELKTIFQGITVDITELPGKQVRKTYPPEGQPAWEISDNVVFITIQPIDNIYDKLRDTVDYAQAPVSGQDPAADEVTIYTRVMQVDWIIYGPDSFDLADKLRWGILNDSTLSTLSASDIAPLTEIKPARLATELFSGRWWKRYDLRAYFNVLTTRAQTVPYLQAAEIRVQTEQGLYGTIDIQE